MASLDSPSDGEKNVQFKIAISDHQLPNLESGPKRTPFCAATTFTPLELKSLEQTIKILGPAA